MSDQELEHDKGTLNSPTHSHSEYHSEYSENDKGTSHSPAIKHAEYDPRSQDIRRYGGQGQIKTSDLDHRIDFGFNDMKTDKEKMSEEIERLRQEMQNEKIGMIKEMRIYKEQSELAKQEKETTERNMERMQLSMQTKLLNLMDENGAQREKADRRRAGGGEEFRNLMTPTASRDCKLNNPDTDVFARHPYAPVPKDHGGMHSYTPTRGDQGGRHPYPEQFGRHPYPEQGERRPYPQPQRDQGERVEAPTKTTLPRAITYNGKGKWSTYESQMRRFFRMHHIQNPEAQLYYISTSLTGDASIYYERMSNRLGFHNGAEEAFDTLRERYGEQNLTQSLVLEFNTTTQKSGEDIQEFHDRLNRIGDQAYPRATEEELEGHVLLRFTLGLLNREAARHIMCQNTKNMRDAMQAYRVYAYSQSALGKTDNPHGGTDVKICSIESQFQQPQTDGEELNVCQVSQGGYQQRQRVPFQTRQQPYQQNNPRFGMPNTQNENLRDIVNKLVTTVNSQGEKIDNLTRLLKTTTQAHGEVKKEAVKLRKPNSTESPQTTPKNDQTIRRYGCYLCGESHRVLECPIAIEYRSENNIRSTDILEETALSLNDDGLTLPA